MSNDVSDMSATISPESTTAWRCGRLLRRCLLVLLTACGLGELPNAAHGLETLVLSVAKLRYDNSIASDNGSLKIRALVDDNSTVGQLRVGLVAGTVTAVITDGGQFNVTLVISGCKLTRSEGVRCRSSDGKVRANFVPTAQGPYIYNMRLQARRLADTVTGATPPIGPVSVILHQPGADRPDVISVCGPDSAFTLLCREL